MRAAMHRNDSFRKSVPFQQVYFSPSCRRLGLEKLWELLHHIRIYDAFDDLAGYDRDHDRGLVVIDDRLYLWDIVDLDPADAAGRRAAPPGAKGLAVHSALDALALPLSYGRARLSA